MANRDLGRWGLWRTRQVDGAHMVAVRFGGELGVIELDSVGEGRT